MLIYHIKQNKPFRTRIRFDIFRHQPECCRFMEKELGRIPGVEKAEVRPKTGSVIVVHPENDVAVNTLVDRVRHHTATFEMLKQKPKTSVTNCRGGHVHYHHSGRTLVFTGMYTAYLAIRRLFETDPVPQTWINRVAGLPFFSAVFLAWPIQKQAIENLKRSGKVDMGIISTLLLWGSILSGNILTAMVISWLFNLSGWMETRIKTRTRKTVRQMLTGNARYVWQLKEGVEIQADIDDILPGAVIILQEGDTIPVDGVVIAGEGLINEASMTGESLSVPRFRGDRVLAGTVMEKGRIRVRVEKTGQNTRLSAIIRLIETAETDQGELGQFGLHLSRIMVPISLLIAGTVFVLTGNLLQAMTLMMITCPCALRLSSSTAVSVAMGRAASEGVLIKGGTYVETAGRANVLVLDKTGTLTGETSRVCRVDVVDRRTTENRILGFAASALKTVSHPLSRAIVTEAEQRGLRLFPCDHREQVAGKGVRAAFGNRRIHVGSREFILLDGIKIKRKSFAMPVHDESLVFVAFGNHLVGCIAVRNPKREDTTRETIQRLRQCGIDHVVLLTGDGRSGTEGFKNELLLDEVRWRMTPEKKAAWVAKRKKNNPKDIVAVVGDGINDTPAFAQGDLSFAVGDGGADVTIEYADIVLQQGGIKKVATTMEIGQDTLEIIRQSYSLAIALNLGALGLTSLGMVSPVAGALMHNLITAFCVTRAAVLSGTKGNRKKRRKTQ